MITQLQELQAELEVGRETKAVDVAAVKADCLSRLQALQAAAAADAQTSRQMMETTRQMADRKVEHSQKELTQEVAAMQQELTAERARAREEMEAARTACATRIRDVQALADKEASKWVDEMDAVRKRDGALMRREFEDSVAKAKALQFELDERNSSFEGEVQQRTVEVTRTLQAQRDALEADLERARSEVREVKAHAEARNNEETMKMLQRTWELSQSAKKSPKPHPQVESRHLVPTPVPRGATTREELRACRTANVGVVAHDATQEMRPSMLRGAQPASLPPLTGRPQPARHTNLLTSPPRSASGSSV